MGASAGVLAAVPTDGSVSSEQQDFAFKVLHYDLQNGALGIKLRKDNPNPLPDHEVFNRIFHIWHAAIKEMNSPYIECVNPAVILYKHSQLSADEIKEINNQILKEVVSRDKAEYRLHHPSKATNDYSQSFGGTAEDTKNEKEAAEILRGGVDDVIEAPKVYQSPYLTPPTFLHQSERQALRGEGKWLRYLSANGCYMYFNTLSHELHSNRPEGYVETELESKEMDSVDTAPVDPANGLPVVEIADLPQEVERIIRDLKKTPLLIDVSEGHVVRTFYTYKAQVEDISPMTVPFGKSGVKKEEFMERCRRKLVGAMKSGQYFVLYMGGVNIEHADLKTKLCKKEVFPKDVFIKSGANLVDDADKRKLIYREEDLEEGETVVREGFHTIVVSSLSPFDFRHKLEDCIPLGYMHPVFVKTTD
jgi:hypothetical protein